MLAKQLTFLANADSAGLVLGARVPIILTSRADSVRSRIASCAVAMLAAHARRQSVAQADVTHRRIGVIRMDDYAVWCSTPARRASSSACIAGPRATHGAWRREARLRGSGPRRGSRPRASGGLLADQPAGRDRDRRARRARRARGWLRSRYGGSRVLGVGHASCTAAPGSRVPRSSPPGILEELRRWCRWRRFISRTTSRRSMPYPNGSRRAAGGLFRHEFPSRPASGRRSGAAAREICRPRRAAIRLPWSVVRVHRVGAAAGRAGDRRRARDRRASGRRREPVRPEERKSVDSSLGFTALDGLCMGTRPGAIDPGVICTSFRPSGSPPGSRNDPLQEIGACSGFPASATTCATCSEATSQARGWRWTTSSIAPPRKSARWRPSSAASTDWCSRPALARTPPKSGGGSARRPPGSASTSIETPMRARGPRISPPEEPRLGLGRSPPTKN